MTSGRMKIGRWFNNLQGTIFPKVKGTGMNGAEFAKKCMHEAGVAIVPGTSFGKFGEGYLRFSYANSKDNILRAIERIDKILK